MIGKKGAYAKKDPDEEERRSWGFFLSCVCPTLNMLTDDFEGSLPITANTSGKY